MKWYFKLVIHVRTDHCSSSQTRETSCVSNICERNTPWEHITSAPTNLRLWVRARTSVARNQTRKDMFFMYVFASTQPPRLIVVGLPHHGNLSNIWSSLYRIIQKWSYWKASLWPRQCRHEIFLNWNRGMRRRRGETMGAGAWHAFWPPHMPRPGLLPPVGLGTRWATTITRDYYCITRVCNITRLSTACKRVIAFTWTNGEKQMLYAPCTHPHRESHSQANALAS